MPNDYDEFVFPEPWWDLRGNGYRECEHRELLVQRLLAEVGTDHPLATKDIVAVAKFMRQDEVLYRIGGGQEFLFAHLTWTRTPPHPYIRLRVFPRWEDAAAMVHEMAEMW